MNDKYVKIVYQSEPIGKYKIILYLTTFDKEAFEKDKRLEEKTYRTAFEFYPEYKYDDNYLSYLEKQINYYVERYYAPYIEELKGIIETQKLKDEIINLDPKNINNSGDIHCNKVYGNINNCNNVYCTEIKGNVVNCEKVIYKK